MKLIDTHAHLNQPHFEADLAGVLQRADEAGVESVICVGITAQSSATAAALAAAHRQIYAAVGIHPNDAGRAGDDDWQRVVTLLDAPRVVALGETGLDRYWDDTPLDVQQEFFARHLRLAQDRDLPVIIHCREAEAETIAVLAEAAGRGPLRGVLHAFAGNVDLARRCLDWGLFVSFAGNVTYTNAKFRPLRESVAAIPDDRLLIETDAPYLVPHPLRGKQKRNEPALVRLTARTLAELRGCPLEDLARQTRANARRLFGLAAD